MNQRKLLIPVVALLGVCVWVGATSMAQSGGGGSAAGFVVVDVVRVFDDCDQIKDLNDLFKRANENFQKEGEARKKTLAQKEAELNAFSPDSPDYAPRRKEFARLTIEANVWLETTRADLRRDFFNWTRVVYEECLKSVEEVARQRGSTLVLQRRPFKPETINDENLDNLRQMIHSRAVVHSDESIDITESVIRSMNQRYKERGGRAKLSVGTAASGQ